MALGFYKFNFRKYFEQCGEISSVKIIMDREKNQSKGFGYISFDDDASVTNAIKLAGSELDGR